MSPETDWTAALPPAPHALRLRYGPVAIDVHAPDEATVVWLGEFLAPAFRSGRAGRGAPDHRVVFGVAPALHASLQRRLRRAPLRGLEGFSFDGSFSRHRGLRDPAGRTWIGDLRAGVFHGVDASGREVSLVAQRADARSRLALMRVVRELATSALLRARRLPVHGAAFAVRAGTVLICGPKRAGKTSLLVHALACGGALVSNDRVFVDAGARPRASAMPTIVMLRNGTLARFPALRAAFETARYDRGRTLAECAPGVRRAAPRARPGFDRPGISAAQLGRLLGAPLRAGGSVRAILFPRIDARAEGLTLRRLSPERAARALAASLLKPSHPTQASALFAPRGRRLSVSPSAERERCRKLARRIPAFECRLGPDAYGADLLALLRDALRTKGPVRTKPPAPAARRGSAGR